MRIRIQMFVKRTVAYHCDVAQTRIYMARNVTRGQGLSVEVMQTVFLS
jgi:hypothetical protein